MNLVVMNWLFGIIIFLSCCWFGWLSEVKVLFFVVVILDSNDVFDLLGKFVKLVSGLIIWFLGIWLEIVGCVVFCVFVDGCLVVGVCVGVLVVFVSK